MSSGEIELEQRRILDEDARDLRPRERRATASASPARDDDRLPERVRDAQLLEVLERVDDERVGHVDRPLERDRRHAPPGRAEPALSHSSTVSPGAGTSSSIPSGSRGRNASGVPVSSGNVP